MAERKIFDLYKRVPVVGFAYGAVRGVAYALAGDDDEFKHSWEMDPADLNPLRMPRNFINSLRSAEYDLDDGIWIGKRSLADQPFGLTFSPGADGFHWCIQINGIIYELGGSKSQVNIYIISKNSNSVSYNQYCKRFSWTMLQGAPSSVSDTRLEEHAKSFENYQYQVMLSLSGKKINCQTFVVNMFAEAANLTNNAAQAAILAVMPNWLF